MKARKPPPRSVHLERHEVRRLLEHGRVLMVRPVMPQPPAWVDSCGFTFFTPTNHFSAAGTHPVDGYGEKFFPLRLVPRSQPWVRERWAPIPASRPAGYRSEKWAGRECWYEADNDRPTWGGRWRPSACMPRRVSRASVEVEGVSVVRVGQLTELQAQATGLDPELFRMIGPEQPFIGEDLGRTRGSHPCLFALAMWWDTRHFTTDSLLWPARPWAWVAGLRRIS